MADGSSKSSPQGGSYADGAGLGLTGQWILDSHNDWTRVTVSSFYGEVKMSTMREPFFHAWIADRVMINEKLLSACQTIDQKLASIAAAAASSRLVGGTSHGKDARTISLSVKSREVVGTCSDLLRRDLLWLQAKAKALNLSLSVRSPDEVSYGVYMITSCIDRAVNQVANVVCGVLAVWTFMIAATVGWGALKSGIKCNHPLYREFIEFFSRDEEIAAALELQDSLDALLQSSEDEYMGPVIGPDEKIHGAREFSYELFLEMLRAIYAHLQHIVHKSAAGDKADLVCNKCGRHGHNVRICTFKGHTSLTF
ncbi:hypothetical protein FVE85_1620 [Porphyridium purpureum]|uniref:CCHC-type domain-containing protein n=1 Tax=Porphyridium purpureum TaxID=35688 RepID=A0A5J4YW15_PORPP|nr:hypothetical protein FVE85_1620 [Porphyridium purpureum]|eukprot:POR0842..scf209_3